MNIKDRKLIVAVDFDGTIVEQLGTYPEFGKFLPLAAQGMRALMRSEKYTPVIFSLRDSDRSSSVKNCAAKFLIENRINVEWACDLMRSCGKFPYDILIDDRAYPNKNNDKTLWLRIIKNFGLKIRPSNGESRIIVSREIDIQDKIKDELLNLSISTDSTIFVHKQIAGEAIIFVETLDGSQCDGRAYWPDWKTL